MIAAAVNKKVKALQLMKNLYLVQDQAFVAAVRAHSTPYISELLEYRCPPHSRYGDKPMMRVRKLARCVVDPVLCACAWTVVTLNDMPVVAGCCWKRFTRSCESNGWQKSKGAEHSQIRLHSGCETELNMHHLYALCN